MRKFLVGLAIAVLVALVASGARADPVTDESASADVNLMVEKYVEIEYFEQPSWQPAVSGGATQVSIYMTFKLNGNFSNLWYWWGIDLNPGVCPSRWYIWGSETQGAYQDTGDEDSDSDTDEYLMFNDDPAKGFGYGLASALILKGITLEDNANDYTDTVIGTATMSIQEGTCPHPGA